MPSLNSFNLIQYYQHQKSKSDGVVTYSVTLRGPVQAAGNQSHAIPAILIISLEIIMLTVLAQDAKGNPCGR